MSVWLKQYIARNSDLNLKKKDPLLLDLDPKRVFQLLFPMKFTLCLSPDGFSLGLLQEQSQGRSG